MIRRYAFLTFLLITAFLCTAHLTNAEPITSYLYITNYEETRFNEFIWFNPGDTLHGRMRTNDFIGIREGFRGGPLYVRRDRWLYDPGYPEGLTVIFAPPYQFPRTFDYLRARADPYISSRNGRYMTRIRMTGFGIEIYQYVRGTPPIDSLALFIGSPDRRVIFIDGEVEVWGDMSGELTIYSSGDMWLMDNIRYVDADFRTGWFEEDQMPHILGLVSDRNIIIKDNNVNGRANGFGVAPNNHNRHSIVINGSLIALYESFTFEHQNDDRDGYQGPQPDERGYIYHKGSLAQWRRGYLHRSNHNGTGYRKSLHYDFRLDRDGPPGFGPGELPEYSGYYESLMLVHGSYTFRFADIGTLLVQPGVEIVLEGQDALRVRNQLEVLGTEETPVTFRTKEPRSRSTIRFDGGYGSTVDIKYAQFTEGIENQFEADTIRIAHSSFQAVNRFNGNTSLDSCIFMDRTHLECWQEMQVNRCVFREGAEIRGNVRNGAFTNNTVVGGRYAGIEINRFRDLRLTGNIVAFNRQGIVNEHYEQPTLEYNDVYDNWNGDYSGCQAGTGSISADPRLVNWERGDCHLDWGSPCIDAGDPEASPDPDGSRSDMGAYPFHNVLSVPGQEQQPAIEFALSAAPNPFNRSTRLNVAVPQAGWITLEIYDVKGRVTYSRSRYLSEGCHRIYIDADDFGAPGVYFVRAAQDDVANVLKLVYLP